MTGTPHVLPSRESTGARARRATVLTPARRRVLSWFADHGHSTTVECATDFAVTKGAVHYSLVALSTMGLVDGVGAVRGIRLTAAGWAALGREPTCPGCGRPLVAGGHSP